MGPQTEERSLEGEFVGGWDAGGGATGILLMRDGLVGTLSGASLIGRERQYQIVFDVAGTVDPDGMLVLELGCAEGRERSLTYDPSSSTDDADAPARADGDDTGEDGWAHMDCTGWDLVLECGLTQHCGRGDCSMVCDVMFFGDAYARGHLSLGDVEEELDYWQRV
jgi:hypothetical protein